MYNYGSPRVGNMAFVKRFNRLVPDAWRVYNARDLVCSVPRMMGFAHVGTPVELRADGTYAVQRASDRHQSRLQGIDASLPHR